MIVPGCLGQLPDALLTGAANDRIEMFLGVVAMHESVVGPVCDIGMLTRL